MLLLVVFVVLAVEVVVLKVAILLRVVLLVVVVVFVVVAALVALPSGVGTFAAADVLTAAFELALGLFGLRLMKVLLARGMAWARSCVLLRGSERTHDGGDLLAATAKDERSLDDS